MCKRYTKEELYKMDAIKVYELVLEGKVIKKFPDGFWQQPEALNNAKIITKHLIEEILKWTEYDITSKLIQKTFNNNKLSGMLQTCFNGSPFNAINTAYDGKYNEWEFGMTPINYWSDINNGIKSVKWLIEDKLKINDEDLKDKLSEKLFSENGLSGMLQQCFAGSPLRAIDTTYPGKFKKEDFKSYNFSFHKK